MVGDVITTDPGLTTDTTRVQETLVQGTTDNKDNV
jgi:hypothetical protein